jgi:hypothetical protein
MNGLLRIATWNLEKPGLFGTRSDAIHNQIVKINADVWVLTETKLSFSPSDDYQCAAVSKEAGDLKGNNRWVAVWVRKQYSFSCIETKDDQRTACALVHLPDGRKLCVYGTVLPWLMDGRFSKVRGSAEFRMVLEEQEKDWYEIKNKHPEGLFCVAGDFNQDLLLKGHYYGSKSGREALKESFSKVELVCLTGGENDPVAKSNPGKASVDHICLAGPTGELATIISSIGTWSKISESGIHLSDHFGVFVDLDNNK